MPLRSVTQRLQTSSGAWSRLSTKLGRRPARRQRSCEPSTASCWCVDRKEAVKALTGYVCLIVDSVLAHSQESHLIEVMARV
jgi:hypothetical protein